MEADGLLLALFALKTNAFRAMSCKTDFIIHLAPIGLGFGKDVTGQVLPLLLHCFCFFSQLLLSKLSLGLRYTPMKPVQQVSRLGKGGGAVCVFECDALSDDETS